MSSSVSALKSHKCKGKTVKRSTSGRFAKADVAALTKQWEARLKKMGLSMERGHDPHRLTYGHMVADLDWDGKVTYTPPTGERLENDEWPISLR